MAKKWYTITVNVFNKLDGEILRDGERLLMDGITRKDARMKAYAILNRVHGHNCTVQIIATKLMK